MAEDDSFAGFDAPELPPADLDFSVKEEPAPVNPDVIVDIKEGNQWVRIPVTHTELFINKDGPSDITRTAKVEFPAEWGGQSISKYVNGFQAQNPQEDDAGNLYDQCRIFFRDQQDEQWQVVHYGYVGGVGPATDTGVFKFWCYDPADLMKGIQVSKSFGEPTIAQVMSFALDGTDENNRPVGVNQRSVFEGIKPYIAGVQEVKEQKEDNRDLGGEPIEGGDIGFSIGPFQLNVTDLVDDIFDIVAGTEVTGGILSGQKRFQINRHNMVDLMDWFAAEVGGKWHFEPTPDGPVMFFDNTSSRGIEAPDGEIARRVFVEEAIIDAADIEEQGENETSPSGFTDKDVFAPVDTTFNDALADIKPFNTLTLFGEATTARERYNTRYGASAAPGFYTEEYPYVKLTYGPLLERAGGYEYSAPPVESDKVYLDQAQKEAIKEFRKHLAEETEGEIELKGEPHILPYDYLRTVPTCNETFQNADANPITYEVNAVKHVRSAGDRYKTTCRVALTFAEEDLTIESKYQDA